MADPAPFRLLQPGIYRDVAVADYFADPCPTPSLTQSIAKVLIDHAPMHAAAQHPRLALVAAEDDADEPERYVKAKAIGNAAHALMIGRGKNLAVAQLENWKGKEAAEIKAGAIAAGKEPILAKHLAVAEQMVAAARKRFAIHPARPLFENGAGEVVLAWKEGDLWFRCMVDWLHNDLTKVDDYKTTGMSAAPHAVDKLMVDAGWDIQAAMIERGLDALDPEGAGRRKFRFVAHEQDSPWDLTVCELPEATLTMGRKKLAYAVEQWAECMASGQWPGYPNETCYPRYPAWAESRWLDRETTHYERRVARRREPMLQDLSGG